MDKILLFLLFSFHLNAGYEIWNTIPVAHEGRYIPFYVYALREASHLPIDALLQQQISAKPAEIEQNYPILLAELQKHERSTNEVSFILESQLPLHSRLKGMGKNLLVLPGPNGEWYPLSALGLQMYHPEKNELIPVPNFTVYPNRLFQEIQNSYLSKETGFEEKIIELGQLLEKGYDLIEGQPFSSHLNSLFTYPSWRQLHLERLYYQSSLMEWLIVAYAVSLVFLVLLNKRFGIFLLFISFAIHTLLLAIRSFVLQRPPVSNMYETILYVPWVSVLIGLISWKFQKRRTIVITSAIAAFFLLTMAKIVHLDHFMHPVQPVLNSQYWLIVHVLMVVGSYGVCLLGGMIAHGYLFRVVFLKKNETGANRILQCMYLGTALLICGTLLGGVWAAQSWGRFWDWDPKESWAFISSAVYLSVIHLYRFNKIGFFGLAVGSILGMQSITFTWYGVNYLLGAGLHSYGFGLGGEGYYYLFIIIEALFLLICYGKHRCWIDNGANVLTS